MNRFPRIEKVRPRNRGGFRQAVAVLAIGAGVFLGGLGIKNYVTPKSQVVAAPIDAEIYTGSILYMPDRGDVCRQWLFDNQNGRFTDNGYVDCARAAYVGDINGTRNSSAARVRVISSAFRGQ